MSRAFSVICPQPLMAQQAGLEVQASWHLFRHAMAMTSVRMPDELMKKLEQVAENLRRSKGWIINDAVRGYVDQAEKQARMLEETQEALADIKAGKTVEGDAVMEWLESWGTTKERMPPK